MAVVGTTSVSNREEVHLSWIFLMIVFDDFDDINCVVNDDSEYKKKENWKIGKVQYVFSKPRKLY